MDYVAVIPNNVANCDAMLNTINPIWFETIQTVEDESSTFVTLDSGYTFELAPQGINGQPPICGVDNEHLIFGPAQQNSAYYRTYYPFILDFLSHPSFF